MDLSIMATRTITVQSVQEAVWRKSNQKVIGQVEEVVFKSSASQASGRTIIVGYRISW
jgi:tRNA A37 methylthiotransferase MiaB